MKTKGSLNVFLRSFYLSLSVILCLLILFFGICKAYENTTRIAFGKTKSALDISKDGIIILDFEIEF